MHFHSYPHSHHHVNPQIQLGALQMAFGVIVVPTVFLAVLFWFAHLV